MGAAAGIADIEFFDATRIDAACRGFSGVVAVGRHLYFAPLNNGDFHGRVLRHDTAGEFADPAAWDVFDCATLDPAARGFVDVLSDGRHLYLVPFCNGLHHGRVVRHDTQGGFRDPASWQVFDLQSLQPEARGFVSGCFDGRHVYFAPYQLDHATTNGLIARFDTQSEFGVAASWRFFDATQVHPDCCGFHSAIDDGAGHVLFVPYLREGKTYNGRLLRLDARKDFADPSAWESFDLTTLDPHCKGYVGGCCRDGQLYLAPYFDGADRHGRALRFDTRGRLADPAAWTLFDCATLDPGSRGFFGAVADADYLYLIPHCRGVGQYHGQITRYRRAMDFAAAAAWSFHDLGRDHPLARGFIGGALHGGHLYLAPFETDAGCHSGLVARLCTDAEQLWSSS
jgi:hypothetical protein